MISHLSNLRELKIDSVVGSFHIYGKDKAEKKVNLSYGIIYNEEGKCQLFKSVKEAEKLAVENYDDNDYIFGNGTKEFSRLTQELLFGKDSKFMREKRICTIQTIGGGGSIFVMLLFLRTINVKIIHLANITYGNYDNWVKTHGFEIKRIRFYDTNIMDINYDWFLHDLNNIENGSCILIQISGHNPCSVNIEKQYFDSITDIALKKNLLFIFDIAYLGLGNKTLEEDILLIRKFQEKNITFGVCKTFSKSMTIYGIRAGVIHIICKDKEQRNKIANHIFAMLRAYYTSPVVYANRIICELLKNEKLKKKWLLELSETSERIREYRNLFFKKLEENQKNYDLHYDWNIYKKQRGLFSFVPLIGKVHEKLKNVYHIYVIDNGRINISGLNKKNIDFVVNSILACLKEIS